MRGGRHGKEMRLRWHLEVDGVSVEEKGGEGGARRPRRRGLAVECSGESRGSRLGAGAVRGCYRPRSGAVGGVQPAMRGLL